MALLPFKYAQGQVLSPFYSTGAVSVSKDLLATIYHDEIVITSLADNTNQRIKCEDELTSICLTPNGFYILSTSHALFKIHSLITGEVIKSLKKAHDAPILVAAADSTSSYFATGSSDGVVKLWDIRGNTISTFKNHGGLISALDFSHNTLLLATGCEDNKVRIFDLVKSRLRFTFEGHTSVVRSLSFTPNDDFLLSGARDNVVNLYDLSSGKTARTIPTFEGSESLGIISCKTPTSLKFYSGGQGGALKIWNGGQTIASAESAEDVDIVDIQQLGQSLIVAYSDLSIVFYIMETLQVTKRLMGNLDTVIDLTFLNQNTLAIATNTSDLKLFDLESNEYSILTGHTNSILCVAVQGDLLVTGSKDSTIRLYEKSIYRATLTGHTESISALNVCSNDFILSGSNDCTIKKWSLSSGKAEFTIKAHDKDINSIESCASFFCSASQDRLIKIWSHEGKQIGALKGHKRGVWSVAISADQRKIVSASGDRSLKIWDVATQSCLQTFEGHTNSVLKVLFMSEDKQLVSSASDGLVKVWDIKSNECTTTLDNHNDRVWALTIKNDGQTIVSGAADSTVTFWSDVSAEETESELKKQSEMVEMEQKLENHIVNKNWREAIVLAMTLDQPLKLLSFFRNLSNEAYISNDGSQTGLLAVDKILAELSDEQLDVLLSRILAWSTKPGTVDLAQKLLNVILKAYPPSVLLKGKKDTIDGLLSYTERRYDVWNNIGQDSFILEWILDEMNEQ